MGFIRLVVFGFLALGVIYLSIAIYARSVHRERLEDDWAEQNPGNDDMAARRVFVDRGMVDYNTSFRPKLIGLVFVIPTIAIAAIVYVTNAN